MNVACPECRSVFRVDPAKVPVGGVRARCAVCGGVMPVSAPAAFVGAPGDTPARSSVAIPAQSAWGASSPPAPAAPFSATPARATTAVATPPSVPAPPPTAAPVAAPTPTQAPTAPTWTPSATPAWRATPALAPSSPPTTAPARPATPATPGRTINPFLANDPNQKAKRLARALVSDIVAYHPQLRDQGMRDGTLKQLFRDEIKKSYEEYVDQVGKEFAETTPHFQDALNEVLAGGRKMF